MQLKLDTLQLVVLISTAFLYSLPKQFKGLPCGCIVNTDAAILQERVDGVLGLLERGSLEASRSLLN